LIELLVVIAIMLVLATLGAMTFSRWQEDRRKTGAVDRLTQWLLIAKQRAKRDQVPFGLRLLPTVNPDGTVFVSQLQYVQQPDNLSGGVCMGVNGTGQPQYQGGVFLGATLNPDGLTETLTFQNVDFIGSAAAGQTDQYEVQPGDYLELFGGGNIHRITQVPSATTLVVADNTIPANPPPPNPPLPNPPQPTTNYRILRQPRPALNEEILTLPEDMIIDMGTVLVVNNMPTYTGVNSITPAPPNPPKSVNVPQRGNFLEILFSPAGGVIGQGTGSGNILLWVRDSTAVPPDLGGPSIVGIQIRTGLIADYPVNPADYYAATREARSSGM